MNELELDDTWWRIGTSHGRRSLWLHITQYPGHEPESIELRAGREGNDDFIRITRNNPQFNELLEVMTTARFAADECNQPVNVEDYDWCSPYTLQEYCKENVLFTIVKEIDEINCIFSRVI